MPYLRGRDDLRHAGPGMLALQADAVWRPFLMRLILYICGQGAGLEWEVGVGLEPVRDLCAHLLLVDLQVRRECLKEAVAVRVDRLAHALKEVGVRLGVVVDDGGRRDGSVLGHLVRSRRTRRRGGRRLGCLRCLNDCSVRLANRRVRRVLRQFRRRLENLEGLLGGLRLLPGFVVTDACKSVVCRSACSQRGCVLLDDRRSRRNRRASRRFRR